MKRAFLGIIAIIAVVASGCMSGSFIQTGNKYAQINPESVIIYLKRPEMKYEEIGAVTGISNASFSWQKAKEQAIYQMKKRAAKVGANGIILLNNYEDPWNGASVSGIAILTGN